MATILITGGAGYIGSHTTKALVGAGHDPIIFDNLSTGHRRLLRGKEFIEGDLGIPADIERVFRSRSIDAVVHFASHCYVGESYRNPYKYYHDNILNALNLLRAMAQAQVKLFIFSSTCAVYGIPSVLPLAEDHPTSPINAYGHSKRCIEWMLEDFRRAHEIQFISLRYFNAAGADPDGQLGELHDPETHLIPRVLMAATGELDCLEIFGRDYSTGDGTCIRDYIHVTDLARAHLIALDRLLAGSGCGIFNLGTGRGFTVQQILEKAEEITGCTIPVELGPRRKGDPAELVADNRLALTELGWKPAYSSLETILTTAWEWFQSTQGDR